MYASMVGATRWFGNKHELQPKRPYGTVGFYLTALRKVHADIVKLERLIQIANLGEDTLKSQELWGLAESMGLTYPQQEDT